jgi:hypothetical protein
MTNTDAVSIGASGANGDRVVTGYMSGIRLIKGTAQYTSAFAPPLAPPTAITNTQLLLNFTNAGIFDNTAKMVFETVSTASISATQSKYGGSSMSFNGTSDYLVSYNNVAIGTADCTIEAWIYPTFTDTGTYAVLTTGPGGTTSNLRFGVNTNQLYLDILGAAVFSGSGATISSNTWSHIAVARTGGTWYGFINGVQMGSTTTQGTTSVTGAERYVGLLGPTGGAGNTPGGWWKGYIDDLRVTQGVARYKSNFTPPTSQLQDQ